jgi:FtsP/CotA-like multicopper oxidase with cupredoxin domain
METAETGISGLARGLRVALPVIFTFLGLLVLFSRPASPTQTPAWDPIDLGGVPEIRSAGGVLDATLVATPIKVQIGTGSFDGAGYNGVYAGPVLRVHPGDRVKILFINHTALATNLHFHGLRVSPDGRADNVSIDVPPGRQFHYDFTIPADHPPGLFFYHDHDAGNAEMNVMYGLGGALIIEGFANQFSGLAGLPQKLVVIKDWYRPGCTCCNQLPTELHCRLVSINGLADWQDRIRPGGTQLWRMANQGANLIMHLIAPGVVFHVIGRDGMPATDGTDTDKIDIMPASRLDVLVTVPKAGAGTIPIIAKSVPTGVPPHFTAQRQIGTMMIDGAPVADPLPALGFPHQQDLRNWHVTAQRTVVFSENAAATKFYVDDKIYDPKRIDARVPLGSIEEWTIKNTSLDFHEFHIHQLGFQVIEINGVAQPFSGFVDDARVPEKGEIKVLIPFVDPIMVGHIMYHCHVLKHEDAGMMAMLEVYQPGVVHICRTPPAE